MPDLALIAQALDFVELNLKEPIAVADMAGAVGYSLYHFCRTFNQATHHTPYDYLMRRRLAESAQTLLQTDEKINGNALFVLNDPRELLSLPAMPIEKLADAVKSPEMIARGQEHKRIRRLRRIEILCQRQETAYRTGCFRARSERRNDRSRIVISVEGN